MRDSRLQPTSTQLQLLRDAAAQVGSNPMLWEILGDAVAATSATGGRPAADCDCSSLMVNMYSVTKFSICTGLSAKPLLGAFQAPQKWWEFGSLLVHVMSSWRPLQHQCSAQQASSPAASCLIKA